MKVSKAIKRSFQFVAVLLLLVIAAAVAIPYFFKDKILQRVKTDMNRTLEADVDFSDVNLSLLSSFPDFSFQMADLKITGRDQFEGIELVNSKSAAFTLDVKSVINEEQPIEIHSIELEEPKIHLVIAADGKANYQIAQPSETTTDDGEYSFVIQLKEYSISNGDFIYDDQLGNMYMQLDNIDHEGQGNFTQDIFDLVTKTQIEGITFRFDGMTYLRQARGDMDITLNIDNKTATYTFKENDIRLNALRLIADGTVQMDWEALKLNLDVKTPQNEFRNLLSLIPSAYTKDFKDVQTNGQFQLAGTIKGDYMIDGSGYPAMDMNLTIKDADFKYPSLPLGMKDIQAQAKISSPQGNNFDKLKVDVDRFHFQLGNNPFDASLKLRNPISDPDIDAKVKGIIDLADLSKALPMEGVQALEGKIDANVVAKARQSLIDRGDYEQVDMKGDMRLQNVVYEATGLPKTLIKSVQMNFSPRYVEVNGFDAKLGRSDVKANGRINNILAYFSPDKTMTGTMKIQSDYFDANEWLEEQSTSPTVASSPTTETAVFDRFDFDISAQAKQIDYDVYILKNTSYTGQISPTKANIKDFRTQIGKSDIKAKGLISNVFNYVFKNQTLKGNIQFNSNLLDLNELMAMQAPEQSVSARNTAGEEMEPYPVPEHIDIDMDANIGRLVYTDFELKNINGKASIDNQQLQLKNCTAKTLGGQVKMDGSYDTRQADRPLFKMKYNVSQFDFRQAFDKLNTFSALAPIGKFIEGSFNSVLEFNGAMGKDMMPDLKSLTASGFLHTLDGVIKNFKPFENLGQQLNIGNFKSLNIKNTKNWFDIADGKVIIKPFSYDYKEVDMLISGAHGVEMDMDYLIKAKIPRKLLEKNAVGNAANRGLDLLNKEADKIGLNIGQAEFINVDIKLTGSITNPKLSIKPVGTGGKSLKDELANQVQEAKDKVVDEAKTKVNEQKDKVEDKGKEVAEDLKNKGKTAVDSIVADPGKAKDKVEDVLKGGEKSVEDAAKDVGKDVGEEVKDGLNKLKDRFKKKKKKKKSGGGG